mmetsp:Transcript_14614/g.34675  ORF Transcript_14614/g.34675 Transcript_14614/m.34675 type:complete len:667 (+) Transcript_14614:77-2077(+)
MLFCASSCTNDCSRGDYSELVACLTSADGAEHQPTELLPAKVVEEEESVEPTALHAYGVPDAKEHYSRQNSAWSRRDLNLSRHGSRDGFHQNEQEDTKTSLDDDDVDAGVGVPHVLRRMGGVSELDLLAPIQEKKIGKRLTLALSRAASQLSCPRCLRVSAVECDRDKVLREAIFGDYVGPDGLVDVEAWYRDVQQELLPQRPVRTGGTAVTMFRHRPDLLKDVLEDTNLPHATGEVCGLDRPLSEYWVNSSHNSYLQGNQLTSTASADAIASLLRNGCRVVELDVYDGSKYGMQGPCVLHGGTATTAVLVETCLKAIREYAFETSSCPVIITLENYLSPDGQRECADLLLRVLGEALYVPAEPETWPSPSMLLNCFLLRDKSYTADEAPSPKQADVWRPVRVPELHRLISIGNVKFRGFKASEEWSGCTSSSFSEIKLSHLLAKYGLEAMRGYTAKHIARIYPAGYRVDSSNYDPQDSWEAGCQMVALNGQKSIFFHPHATWLNAGRFRGNGGCGFVPKPCYLLGRGDKPSPQRLAVTVLGGDGWEAFRDFDIIGPPDSYVCVEIAGAAADRKVETTAVYTARARTGSKAQPIWKQRFEFDVTETPLAILMLIAWDQDVDFDDLLGQYAFPLSELKPGWRRVPLLSSSGEAQDGNPALICFFELD